MPFRPPRFLPTRGSSLGLPRRLATFVSLAFSAAVATPAPTTAAPRDASSDLRSGVFNLNERPVRAQRSATCRTGTRLTLDTGRLVGPFAVLEATADGSCSHGLDPAVRFLALSEVLPREPCGTRTWQGYTLTPHGRVDVAIVDSRARAAACGVPPRSPLVVKEAAEGVIKTLYAAPPHPSSH
jgi:hypothetical protein